jgi:NAD(P)-dependent dehydrogenase (short-subunit alcohol dehydrogenase family)
MATVKERTALQQPIGSGFSAKSTSSDVLVDIDLTGKTVIVTGGYSGLGLEATLALTAAGARVVVPARRPDIARAALDGTDSVEVDELDLADLASVRGFTDRFAATRSTIDVIITCAGVMACPEQRVGPGWEMQFATNHLGHFALVNQLAPLLNPDGSRVVSVTSGANKLSGIRWSDIHFERDPYDRWQAYGQSKTANVLFALQLGLLGSDRGILAYSATPGSIITPLQRHVPRAEQVASGWIDEEGRPNPDFKTPAQGAATFVWAATSPLLAGLTGVYCEDCDLSTVAALDGSGGDVATWALDPSEAERLWEYSTKVTGVDARSLWGA